MQSIILLLWQYSRVFSFDVDENVLFLKHHNFFFDVIVPSIFCFIIVWAVLKKVEVAKLLGRQIWSFDPQNALFVPRKILNDAPSLAISSESKSSIRVMIGCR